jgi:hypothetical protein
MPAMRVGGFVSPPIVFLRTGVSDGTQQQVENKFAFPVVIFHHGPPVFRIVVKTGRFM